MKYRKMMQRLHLCRETSSRIEEDSENKKSHLVCVVPPPPPPTHTQTFWDQPSTSVRGNKWEEPNRETGRQEWRGARGHREEKPASRGGEGEISLSQNQFPRPRVHFINQHRDRSTHTAGWLGLLPSTRWCPPLPSFLLHRYKWPVHCSFSRPVIILVPSGTFQQWVQLMISISWCTRKQNIA